MTELSKLTTNLDKDIIHYLYKRKLLQLKAIESHKKLEVEHVSPFYDDTKINFKMKIIYFHNPKNKSINQQIWDVWTKKYDLFIISFKSFTTNIDDFQYILTSLPKFPIYYDEYLIITPVLFYLLNGFSNRITDKRLLLEDFFSRVADKLGVIMASKYFHYPEPISFDKTGFHDFFQNPFLREPNVFKVNEWMVDKFETNDFGWFSPQNHLLADYLFQHFHFKKVVEFGIFMGYSTRIFLQKNPNLEYYCFDRFTPLFLTEFSAVEVKPNDTNFFFKYMRFETFHANIKEFKNVYTIEGDINDNIPLLKKYNIQPDLIYIDFIKKDHLVIKFVDYLVKLFPNAIIFGDDAVFLNKSLTYFKKKYNSIILDNCYVVSKNKKFPHSDEFIRKVQEDNRLFNEKNIEVVARLPEPYKIHYICRLIDKHENILKIIMAVDYLKVQLNKRTKTLENEDNIYHYLCKKYKRDKDPNYIIQLYIELNKIQKDKNVKNNFNLIPYDYINYFIEKF